MNEFFNQKRLGDTRTIQEVKRLIASRIDDGVICPCCNRFMKRYKRKFNSGMAASLIFLVKACSDENGIFRWSEISKEAPRHVINSREIGKLVHWGLAVEKENKDKTKKMSGFWKPTVYGVNFVYADSVISKYVYLLNNVVTEFSDEKIDIFDALGDKFNYEELMK